MQNWEQKCSFPHWDYTLATKPWAVSQLSPFRTTGNCSPDLAMGSRIRSELCQLHNYPVQAFHHNGMTLRNTFLLLKLHFPRHRKTGTQAGVQHFNEHYTIRQVRKYKYKGWSFYSIIGYFYFSGWDMLSNLLWSICEISNMSITRFKILQATKLWLSLSNTGLQKWFLNPSLGKKRMQFPHHFYRVS